MLVPRFWQKAEGTVSGPSGPYRFELWGWSQESAADALTRARRRLSELVERARRGELGGAYLYGSVPLREEIVHTLGGEGPAEAVVTRNRYGALVLNTAQVPFIDIDRPEVGVWTRLARALRRTSADDAGLEPIREACRRSGASFRIYATRAGYRLLVTDRCLDPQAASTEAFLADFGADPFFIKLCKLQRSFRARLTPKPWRCGCTPPPGQFPREDPALEAAFRTWLAGYEAASSPFAACTYLEAVGPGRTLPEVRPIVEEHDRRSRALESLPLA